MISQENDVVMTLSITLPIRVATRVRALIARDSSTDLADYIQTLIVADQKLQARRELDAMLIEGSKGPFTPLDRAEWDEMRREALEGLSDDQIRS